MATVTAGDELQKYGLPPSANAAPARTAVFLAWPIFLACSWTWVIGMYLPLLLRERYGWGGYIIFAIPNIAGVMLFAWGVKNAAEARAMVKRYRPAMVLFSLITAAFHAWFFTWVWNAEFNLNWYYGIIIGLSLIAAARLTAGLPDRIIKRLAIAVYATSIALLIYTVIQGWPVLTGASPATRVPLWDTRSDPEAWVFLTPVMLIGFLLCPYFDLTFHRAYQAVSNNAGTNAGRRGGGGGRAGRWTFLMFGLFFGIMILFTAVYAVTGFSWAIIVHLILQGWFTTTIHLREILKWTTAPAEDNHRNKPPHYRAGRWLLWLPLLAVLLGPIPQPWFDYRNWLLFYGLLFPIYALLREVRRRRGRQIARNSTLAGCLIFCIPFGAAGFLGDFEWALLIPTTGVLLLGLLGGSAANNAHASGPSRP